MDKIIVNSPLMKGKIEFINVENVLSFLSSQFSVVPSFYGSSVTADVFSINVCVSSGIVCNMFIPVDSVWNDVHKTLLSWFDCVSKL